MGSAPGPDRPKNRIPKPERSGSHAHFKDPLSQNEFDARHQPQEDRRQAAGLVGCGMQGRVYGGGDVCAARETHPRQTGRPRDGCCKGDEEGRVAGRVVQQIVYVKTPDQEKANHTIVIYLCASWDDKSMWRKACTCTSIFE